ncbi:glycosyltransferase family 9 protein [Bacteroidota bacterium]
MKVLVIRLSSIGDIVLTSPVIRALKSQVPSLELHFVVKKRFLDVVKENPFIDKIHVLDTDLGNVIRELKAEKFDYIIDLHKNFRSFKIKTALKEKSFTFKKHNWEKWLLVNRKINSLPDVHIVDRYFQAVNKLGVKNDDLGLDYFISDQEKSQANEFISQINEDFYAVVVAGNYFTKQYPAVRLIELIRKLDKKVILLGGKNEMALAQEVESNCNDKVVNLCGTIPLNVSAGIVMQAKGVFTNDTGLMHIAAAYKRRTVVFWGNTVPDFGMFPYKTSYYNAQVNNLHCRPCSKLGYKKCPEGHFKCMLDIDQQAIISWIRT